MATYIALLRAVNAGGENTLTTQNFIAVLEHLKLQHIKTYIQTGNAIFQTTAKTAKTLPEKLKEAIKDRLGFAPDVIVLSLAELEAAIAANPYPKANENPKSLHVVFLASVPKKPDLESLQKLKTESEGFALEGKVFYFYAPEGVGRSKAFSKIEKSLGVVGTARNWRTAQKLLEMAKELKDIGIKENS
ncbi:MAG: DUF1697 domain-containing protein [Trueperaceae bacterium]